MKIKELSLRPKERDEWGLPTLSCSSSFNGWAGSSGKKLTPTHLPSIAGAGRLAHLSSLQVELKERHKFLHLPPSTIRRVSPTLNVLHLQLIKNPGFRKGVPSPYLKLSVPKRVGIQKLQHRMQGLYLHTLPALMNLSFSYPFPSLWAESSSNINRFLNWKDREWDELSID